MRLRPRFKSTHLAAVVGVTLSVGCGWFLLNFPFGRGLKHASYDLVMVARGDVKAEEAVIVYLDDDSYERLGQNYTRIWDRDLHAKLIDRLTDAGAKAVVMDIVFSEPSVDNPRGDEALVAAMKRNGKVVIAADNKRSGLGDDQKIAPLFEPIRDAAANLGSDEVVPDLDLVVRLHTARLNSPLSSLSWAAAELVKAPITQKDNEEDKERWLNYYGPPNHIPSTSYYAALDSSQVPDSFFHDKVVFIGARILTHLAGERKDEYRNPFNPWLPKELQQKAPYIPGVEIQATAFLNLLRADWARQIGFALQNRLICLLGILFGLGLLQFRPVWATAAAAGAAMLVAGSAYALFVNRLLWFPWLIVFVQIAVALFWSILFNSIQLYVQKRLYEQTLRLYLPPKLVAKFSKTRDFLRPGARKQRLTLLFSDIASFTSISEGMDSDELAAMMNAYFQNAVAKCIHKADGTVAKYIGDAIFAFWNAPDEQADHALLACHGALLFRVQASEPVRGRLLPTRIGLHTGEANVGNFGSEDRVDYTALGDSVNLASRLEGLNKHLGTMCLMSGTTQAEVGDRVVTRALGSFQLKGFEGLVAVHELVGGPEAREETRPWCEAFAEALNNFEHRHLEFAEIGFRRVLELKPEDGPSKFYLHRISELAAEALPENWATYTILKEK